MTDPMHAPSARRRWWITSVVFALVALVAYSRWTGSAETGKRGDERGRAAHAAPVTATAATTGDIGVYVTGLGSVTPLATVSVRPRVDGQLMTVLFREGDVVHAGDVLAEIDPRPFEVQLTQAEGQIARDRALLGNAKADLERYQPLYKEGVIPKQQLDTQAALVRQYEGAVQADQGQIDNAKLELVYCHVTAPIGGRLGLRLVDPGNVVHANDPGGLVVITQQQPTAVVFTIAEDNLPPIVAKLAAGERLPVEAWDREQRNRLATGSLLTVDNQIDPSTGTVRLKAEFPNDDRALFPNQFVNARLLLDVRREATLVPEVAIQRGVQGTFVYVVKPDHKVEVRPVRVDVTEGGNAAIAADLAAGELVVVDGAEGLREGATVELQAGNDQAPREGAPAEVPPRRDAS